MQFTSIPLLQGVGFCHWGHSEFVENIYVGYHSVRTLKMTLESAKFTHPTWEGKWKEEIEKRGYGYRNHNKGLFGIDNDKIAVEITFKRTN